MRMRGFGITANFVFLHRQLRVWLAVAHRDRRAVFVDGTCSAESEQGSRATTHMRSDAGPTAPAGSAQAAAAAMLPVCGSISRVLEPPRGGELLLHLSQGHVP